MTASLPPYLKFVIVDDHPLLRRAIRQQVENVCGPDALTSFGIQGEAALSAKNSESASTDEIANALAVFLKQGQQNRVEAATDPGIISTSRSKPSSLTNALPLILIHLNLKTKSISSRFDRGGLAIYEALLAKIQTGPKQNGRMPIPPALFYTLEPISELDLKCEHPAAQCWTPLADLAKAAGEDASAIIWRLTAQSDARHIFERAWRFWQAIAAGARPALTYLTCVTSQALERANARTRHAFSDHRRPVVRILLGAVKSGDVSWPEAKHVLHALCASEPKRNKAYSTSAVDEYPVDILNNYIVLKSSNPAEGPPLKSNRNYILIDDGISNAEYQWNAHSVLVNTGAQISPLTIAPKDSGWGAALCCITRSAVSCLKDAKGLSMSLTRDADYASKLSSDVDAIFLDYNLRQTRNGGYYLAFIKSHCFDLPVVMFTGLDESNITKWCLCNGASAYFVKETIEAEGRNSLDAYRNLRSTLCSLPIKEGGKRNLWRRFVRLKSDLERLEAITWNVCYEPTRELLAGGGAVLEPVTISWNLRQAFYWLFAAEQDIDLNRQSPTARRHAQADKQFRIKPALAISIYAQNAFEHLLGAHWLVRINKEGTIEDWFFQLRRNSDGVLGALRLAGLESLRKTFRINYLEKRAKDSHQHMPTLREAMVCLDVVLDSIASYFKSYNTYLDPLAPPLPLPSIKQFHNGPKSHAVRGKSENHAKKAELGASEIVSGWAQYVCADPELKEKINASWLHDPGQTVDYINGLLRDPNISLTGDGEQWRKQILDQHKILLIDDTADATGWANALKVLCGRKSITVWSPQDFDLKGKSDLLKFDLILLDLRMPSGNDTTPSPMVGIEKLLRIQSLCRAIPVVMLTSSDEAHWTYKALKIGAANYFLKNQNTVRPHEAAARFLSIIRSLTKQMGRKSVARKAWNDLEYLKKLQPPRIPSQDIFQFRMGWIPVKKAEAPEALRPWLKELISKKLDSIYDSFLRALSFRFNPNQRIDLNRWLFEQLNDYGSHENSHIFQHTLLLALNCGQLVECLTYITMACDPSLNSNWLTVQDVLTEMMPKDQGNFWIVAEYIWKERHHGAHGFTKKFYRSAIDSREIHFTTMNPESMIKRSMRCAREWLRWLEWKPEKKALADHVLNN